MAKTDNFTFIVVGVILLIILVISIFSFVYASQVNNNLNDTNNQVDDIDTNISAISYTNNQTNVNSNLTVIGSIIANGVKLDSQITDLQNQITALKNKLKPYIDNVSNDQINILTPTTIQELITGNLTIDGPFYFNGVDITNTITDLQTAWQNAVSTGILNLNKAINSTNNITSDSIATNNFSCVNYFGGIKAYVNFLPSATPNILVNNGCTVTYVSVGEYNVVVDSTITGIIGLPICTSSEYTTYLTSSGVYNYTIRCKSGGSSPAYTDASIVWFMLI